MPISFQTNAIGQKQHKKMGQEETFDPTGVANGSNEVFDENSPIQSISLLTEEEAVTRGVGGGIAELSCSFEGT